MIRTSIPGPPLGPTTFGLDKQLPKLPLPSVQRSCELYLEAVKPFCATEEEWDRVNHQVQTFLASEDVHVAQKHLQDKWERTDHYFDDWWTQFAYLQERGSLPPVEGMFVDFPPFRNCSQLLKASRLVLALTQFYEKLETEELSVMGTDGSPLSMDQYRRLFHSHRPPGVDIDRQTNSFCPQSEQAMTLSPRPLHHCVVASNGMFFKFTLQLRLPRNKVRWVSESECRHVLQRIQKLSLVGSRTSASTFQVGCLTSLPRATWATARSKLCASHPENAASLAAIESALFVLCLDVSCPSTPTETIKEICIGREAGNRFYDHSMQWVVFGNGTVGHTFEHSQLDAIPCFRMYGDLYDIMKRLDNEVVRQPTSLEEKGFPEKQFSHVLNFYATPSTADLAGQAITEYAKVRNNWHIYNRRIPGIGKRHLKQLGVSPDSFVQIAFQLAYYELYGRIPSTYEAVATLGFRKGRTETGRSVSMESLAFVRAMSTGEKSQHARGELAVLLQSALATHGKTMAEAMKGRGFDRHLLCLKIQCQLLNLQVPELLQDGLFARSSRWDLSTSAVTAPKAMRVEGATGFHPVGDHSTGIVYGIYDESVDLTVMNTNTDDLVPGVDFVAQIEGAMSRMKVLIDPKARM